MPAFFADSGSPGKNGTGAFVLYCSKERKGVGNHRRRERKRGSEEKKQGFFRTVIQYGVI